DGDELHGALARDVGCKWMGLRSEKNYPEADSLKAAAEEAGLILRDMKTVVQAEMTSAFNPAKLEALK
ncbi:MAG: cysteine--tRNA ligase, partial [Boseongicola sp.]